MSFFNAGWLIAVVRRTDFKSLAMMILEPRPSRQLRDRSFNRWVVLFPWASKFAHPSSQAKLATWTVPAVSTISTCAHHVMHPARHTTRLGPCLSRETSTTMENPSSSARFWPSSSAGPGATARTLQLTFNSSALLIPRYWYFS